MKFLLSAAVSLFALSGIAFAADPDPANWYEVLQDAKGETVYWNAWGGANFLPDR